MTPVLAHNLERVRERIARACRQAGRSTEEVELLPVTKQVAPELAAELLELGLRDLAENRVDALERKAVRLAELGRTPRWHLIGHLQRNKARRAVRVAAVIHSVDSLRLLEALERAAAEESRALDVYLEMNLVEIEGRTGLAPRELEQVLDAAGDLARVRLVGLMTMAAPDAQAREGDLASQTRARQTFGKLRELRDALTPSRRARFAGSRVRLSMGMSSDLEAAIHEGADLVRVGSALFAESS